MKYLNFVTNWNNKLKCDAFTTFRIYEKWKFKVGEKWEIRLRGTRQFDALVVDVKVMRLDQVNEFIAHLDTGYNKKEFEGIINRMYGRKHDTRTLHFALVLFKKVKEKPLTMFTDDDFEVTEGGNDEYLD